MSSLPLPLAAFAAGLISFLSPCVLLLVPGYVSLISGVGVEELKSPPSQLTRRMMVNSGGFILGFSIVFITLGGTSTEIGPFAAGVLIIIFGLHLTGMFRITWLLQDAQLQILKGSSTLFGAFVMGFAFALGWTPCLRPILTAILGFANQEGTVVKGMLLLAVYSMGLAMPFLLTSLLLERFLRFSSRIQSHMRALEVASGGLLIALGVLLVIRRLALIPSWFQM